MEYVKKILEKKHEGKKKNMMMCMINKDATDY